VAAVFKVGQAVQVIAPPQRKGHVIATAGTGLNARITVSLTGWAPATFTPSQIQHI
jgi:hypothetical protein